MEIDFLFENPENEFPFNEKEAIFWIGKIIESEQMIVGNISFFFCTDDYLLAINQKYLQHDTYTDIITFDYVEDKIISGDILISIERITENAKIFGESFNNELRRVMAHGVLHLLGYKDKTLDEKQLMKEKEDFYLTLHP